MATRRARDTLKGPHIYGAHGWEPYHSYDDGWYSRPEESVYGLAATAWTSSDHGSNSEYDSDGGRQLSADGSADDWSSQPHGHDVGVVLSSEDNEWSNDESEAGDDW